MPRIVLAGLVSLVLGASAEPARARGLNCYAKPAACQRALSWSKHERRALRERLHERWQLARPVLADAAFIAARVYRVDPWAMLRVSRCEIRGSFRPRARDFGQQNPTTAATGPWQFLASTWSATPFARWSPTNAYVAALAVAQIVQHDGGYRQWSCQP